MAEPALTSSSTPKLSSTENGARPKVLRRPAQFSSPSPASNVVPIPVAKLELIPENKDVVPPSRAWQDDARFGITLVAMLLIINAAVIFWLSRGQTPANTVTYITQSASDTSSAALPAETLESDSVPILDDEATVSTTDQ